MDATALATLNHPIYVPQLELLAQVGCFLVNINLYLECGNGQQDGLEPCDDGNTLSGDGCSSVCLIELGGWLCPTYGQPCTSK
jgi:cysteine-rich repeat protein